LLEPLSFGLIVVVGLLHRWSRCWVSQTWKQLSWGLPAVMSASAGGWRWWGFSAVNGGLLRAV